MFVIRQAQSYAWPVQLELPVSGGKYEKHSFDAEFKKLPQSRINELLKREGITDSDVCREVLVGWKGVFDEKNNELPFSEVSRDELVDIPLVATGIVTAFFESLSGAKRKNS
jgi:hypothetical protein